MITFSRPSVCVASVANLYQDRIEVPQQMTTQVVKGEPVNILETIDDWALVEAAHYPGKPGWTKLSFLTEEEKALKGWLDEERMFEGRPPHQVARQFINTPYLWGGMTEKGIDCSGLVHLAYRRLGKLIPRDGCDIEEARPPLAFEKMRPGDLITYGQRDDPLEGRAAHIAFWMGSGRILHAFARDVNKVILHKEPEDLFPRRRHCLRFA